MSLSAPTTASQIRPWPDLPALLHALDGVARVDGDGVEVLDEGAFRGHLVDELVRNAVFAADPVRGVAPFRLPCMASRRPATRPPHREIGRCACP